MNVEMSILGKKRMKMMYSDSNYLLLQAQMQKRKKMYQLHFVKKKKKMLHSKKCKAQ